MFGWTDNARRRRRGLLRLAAAGSACAAAVIVCQPASALAVPRVPAGPVTFTKLTLINGWRNAAYGSAKAAVADISGIITFKGGIWTNGNSFIPFRLPKAFRPATDLYLPVDQCEGNFGRLWIQPSGVVEVASESKFTNATCFTSLDGVSFAKSPTSFTALKLLNGWRNAPYKTSKAEVRVISGIVHFKGGIWTPGSNMEPFVLPKGFRPAADLYIPVEQCSVTKGRLYITTAGTVTVEAEQSLNSARCFTSLDGASFALSAKSFTPLTLKNGWHSYGSGTAKAAVRLISGVVHFRGAISTSGTSSILFTLPKSLRPATYVWTPVDLCNANNGRLYIQPDGVVTVEEEGGIFKHASCFTSLDGAWFAK